MTKNKIITFFLVLFTILFFLGITVFAIIISRGGLITKEGIVETSVIKVDVEPNVDFTIYVDGQIVKLQDDRINQLQEGTYNIVIEADNYARWEKNVSVTPGIVSTVNVKLYPATYSLEQVTQTNIDRAYFSADGQYAYYVVSKAKESSANGIWRLKLTTGAFIFGNQNPEPEKLVNVGPLLSPIIAENNYDIFFSDDNSRFLLQNNEDGSNYIFSATEFNSEPEYEINTLLGINPDKIFWFTNGDSLIIEDNELLFEYQLNNNQKTIIILDVNETTTYAIADNLVYFTNDSGALMSYSSGTPQLVSTSNKIIPNTIEEIIPSMHDSDKLIFKTAESYYFVDIDSEYFNQITDSSFELVEFSPDGNSAIFTKENIAYTFNIKEIIATNSFESKFASTHIELNKNDRIGFSPQSANLVYYDSELGTIIFTDTEGDNVVVALTDLVNANLAYSVNSSGDKFYITLEDELESPESTINTNLYRIDLEAQN